MNSRADEMAVRMCLEKKEKKMHFKKGVFRNIPALSVQPPPALVHFSQCCWTTAAQP